VVSGFRYTTTRVIALLVPVRRPRVVATSRKKW